MDSRELAYFVAVAEERNFSRAAVRLGIAQPPLSRAIQRLERRLDLRLLDRSSRTVSLTHAGEVLLQEGRRALAALAAAERAVRDAGRVRERLRVVAKPGGDAGLLEPLLAQLADTIEVEVLICRIGEEKTLLRAGTADVALLRLPQHDLSGLATDELLTERELVVLPRTHRLATRASVRMADLIGETFPRWTTDSPGHGPVITDTGQVAELIALGRMIAVLPESVARDLGRDLVTIPVDGRATTLLAAWCEERRDRALAVFVRTAAEVAAVRSTARSTA
ncbi:LysR family transcriptional regulator [Amycolatopsis endophytica]|uniref:DNA-binding transcriptional LysR family regulator n=1 Tax=Amycolatopsis endophytica TaxID=860233 RepID=A0A853AXH2_9PSEU|nr:LysR family transcriptional regulator [Amycolatopsis endophytica]NYI87281.1 DNA-binding transcriptional LysR family regulator [Amycolatopsis endophytica]